MQRGLFDPDENGTGGDIVTRTVVAPLCRSTDPQTSYCGAVYAEELRDRHKRAVLDVADAVPRTANELAVRVIQRGGQWNQETLRKRVRELCVDDGLLIACGEKICSWSQRSAAAYRKTES